MARNIRFSVACGAMAAALLASPNAAMAQKQQNLSFLKLAAPPILRSQKIQLEPMAGTRRLAFIRKREFDTLGSDGLKENILVDTTYKDVSGLLRRGGLKRFPAGTKAYDIPHRWSKWEEFDISKSEVSDIVILCPGSRRALEVVIPGANVGMAPAVNSTGPVWTHISSWRLPCAVPDDVQALPLPGALSFVNGGMLYLANSSNSLQISLRPMLEAEGIFEPSHFQLRHLNMHDDIVVFERPEAGGRVWGVHRVSYRLWDKRGPCFGEVLDSLRLETSPELTYQVSRRTVPLRRAALWADRKSLRIEMAPADSGEKINFVYDRSYPGMWVAEPVVLKEDSASIEQEYVHGLWMKARMAGGFGEADMADLLKEVGLDRIPDSTVIMKMGYVWEDYQHVLLMPGAKGIVVLEEGEYSNRDTGIHTFVVPTRPLSQIGHEQIAKIPGGLIFLSGKDLFVIRPSELRMYHLDRLLASEGISDLNGASITVDDTHEGRIIDIGRRVPSGRRGIYRIREFRTGEFAEKIEIIQSAR